MAGRPEKNTVDYFPHFVKGGKTLFILQSQYKNDGYAFWYKLLSILSDTDNHVFDTRNPLNWQFLLAETLVSEETGVRILNLLSELDAIDAELWKHKVIWVQNLVNNFAEIYKKRKRLLPQRPDIKTIVGGNNSIPAPEIGISAPEISQSKVKKSKVKKIKEKGVIGDAPSGAFVEGFVLPEWIDKVTWESFLDVRKRKRAPNTPHALNLIIRELEKFRQADMDPKEIINQSTMRGWTGVFPLREQTGGNGNVNTSGTGSRRESPQRITGSTTEITDEQYLASIKGNG